MWQQGRIPTSMIEAPLCLGKRMMDVNNVERSVEYFLQAKAMILNFVLRVA
jgi:hypothetical protein